jgi:hypothetical protein
MRTTFAVLLLTLFCAAAEGRPVIPPSCSNPAPYTPAPAETCAAPESLIILVDGTDETAAAAELEQRCGYRDTEILSSIEVLIATLTPSQIACVRCDPRVVIVEENFGFSVPGLPGPYCAPPTVPTLSEIALGVLAGVLAIVGSLVAMRR